MVGKNARLISPSVRRVYGVIETYENDINLEYITQDDYLKTITIERVGEEGKFFGFGICQKLNTHLTKSDYPITTATTIKAAIYDDTSFYSDMFPPFKVTEVHKDENNGELSITAYDAIYKAAEHTIDELNTTVTTINQFAQDIAIFLDCNGAMFYGAGTDEACFNAVYNETALANYEGTETIRSVLDDIAEATQTIYYINNYNYLIFKRLNKDGEAALTITKNDYITLDSGENRRLTNLVSATELGDNLTATLKGKASGEVIKIDDVSENLHTLKVNIEHTNPEAVKLIVYGEDEASAVNYYPDNNGTVSGVTSIAPTMNFKTDTEGAVINIEYEKANTISGTTQYIRNNPFWDLRADRAELVDEALATVWGMTINQFDCVWRGNPALEIGDKIALITKDNEEVKSYVLNDVIDYSGGLTQRTSWHYTESEQTASNPSNLGEALTQTFAKVDKINKQIEMVVSGVEGNTEVINQLMIDKAGIEASVSKVQKNLEENVGGINENIDILKKGVEAQITAEDVQLQINTEISKGAQKVVTSTGYTFNEEGLTVEKSGSEMKTTISDDGMRVYRNNHEVLTADNKGVKAENLHATTYLIIGSNSRFEDYGGRTGCFWIG